MQKDWSQPFVNMSILDGEGYMDGQAVKKGDHFLICSGYGEMKLEGKMEFIYSHL